MNPEHLSTFAKFLRSDIRDLEERGIDKNVRESLKKHLRDVETKIMQYECKHESVTFSAQAVFRYIRFDRQIEYQYEHDNVDHIECDNCGKTWVDSEEFNEETGSNLKEKVDSE